MSNTDRLKNQMTNLPANRGGEIAVVQDRITAIVESQANEYINLWGGQEKANRFMQSLISALMQNPDLAKCTPASIKKAGIDCAVSGLTPGSVRGEAWLIKYGNTCQLQVGYVGYRNMFFRSPLAKFVRAWAVYENDYFDDKGNYHAYPEFRKSKGNRGSLVGFFCVAELSTGGIYYDYMSIQEINDWKKRYSKGWQRKDSAWQTNPEGMGKKTVLVRTLKDCPMEDIQMTITQEEKHYAEPHDTEELLGGSVKPDPNEIIIPEEDIHDVIAANYRTLIDMDGNTWTMAEIRKHNAQILGMENAKNCDDMKLLNKLKMDLENRIDQIDAEIGG